MLMTKWTKIENKNEIVNKNSVPGSQRPLSMHFLLSTEAKGSLKYFISMAYQLKSSPDKLHDNLYLTFYCDSKRFVKFSM